MKKVLSLLLVICMTMAVCVPSAYAAEDPDIVLETAPLTNVGEIEEPIPSVIDEENEVDPLLVVAEGSRAYLNYITVYPGIVIDGAVKYDSTLGTKTTFPEQYIGGAVKLSSTKTQDVLDNFLNRYGLPAEVWVMEVQYIIYTDTLGSYGRYFEFTTNGNLVAPAAQSNGSVRYTISRMTGTYTYTLQAAFEIPDTTSAYYVGLNGGYYYYNYNTRTTLSQGVNASAYLNQGT